MPLEAKLRLNEITKSYLAKNFNLIEDPLPDDIKYKKVEKDGKITEAKHWEYHTDKLFRIKFSEINAEDRIYIRTCVIAPNDDYDFPIFSYDNSEARKYIFFIFDTHPLMRTPDYMKKYIDPVRKFHEESLKIPFVEGAKQTMVDWAKAYESGAGVYLRYSKEYEEKVESIFKGYLEFYVNTVKEAKKISSPALKEELIKFKNGYRQIYKEKDPGFGPMKALFGEEWAKKSFENFPF